MDAPASRAESEVLLAVTAGQGSFVGRFQLAETERPVFVAEDWLHADLGECPAQPIGTAGPDECLAAGVLNPLHLIGAGD